MPFSVSHSKFAFPVRGKYAATTKKSKHTSRAAAATAKTMDYHVPTLKQVWDTTNNLD